MKEKIKAIFEDERKKTIAILVIVLVLLISIILIALLFRKDETEELEEFTTLNVTTTQNIFKGFKVYEVDTSKKISYDVKSQYKFIYADKEDRSTVITRSDDNFIYELYLKDGTIEFKEQRYNTKLNAYEYTSKAYTYKSDNKITDYIVIKDCEGANYSIVAKDSKNKVYMFESIEDEFDIDYIINNFKNIKTISTVSKVGYYSGNNDVEECYNREIIYLDTVGNVRYLSGKNEIFFNDSYYRYIGDKEYNNQVYVLKDGLMNFANSTKNLYDGKHNIKYRGSFYEIRNGIENIYIIGTDGYLYVINDLKESSNNLLTRLNNNKITRIGTRAVINSNNFATNLTQIKIEFEGGDTLTVPETLEFEFLN